MNPKRTENQPNDRLTELAGVMVAALENEPGVEDVRAIAFVDTDERGGICLHGYEHDMDAVVAMLVHLTAIFEANGKTLIVMPLEQFEAGGQG